MIEQLTIKGKHYHIHLKLEAFNKLREYLINEYKDKKYGWLISSYPIKTVYDNNEWGVYQLSNIIPTYIQDNILIENIGEYNDYLQMLSMYNNNLIGELNKIFNQINIEILPIED